MRHDPISALRIPDFRKFVAARFFLTFSLQIQSVLVGWQVYELTGNPLSLGLIGLSEALPALVSSLYAGYLADRVERKKILMVCGALLVVCSMLLYVVSMNAADSTSSATLQYIYIIIFISGIARGFFGPALFSFMPQLIEDKSLYTNAVTWNSTIWQVSSTVGPAIGGLMIAPLGISHSFLVDMCLCILSLSIFTTIPGRKLPQDTHSSNNFITNFTEGARFLKSNPALLGAMSLDMFAVLFGGATALLPAVAKDILHVGAFEFGLLRSATSMGSIIIAIYLAYRPIRANAGIIMLRAVACFALCIVAFGFSTHLYLSFILLLLSGVFDGLSVVIRATMLQTLTPDYMKGRVSAINNIFLGSSNEIGAFWSGLTASWFGTRAAIIFGGIISLGVVGIVTYTNKKLRESSLTVKQSK
ncbi:MAG: MFS transporter [Cytophagales bacterium]|nr:MFS transporter [Cytophagales bacterium]